jgi:hypothetical protein
MQAAESGSSLLVQAHLRQLPEFEPDPALWARIESAHARQANARRWRHGGWLASGLAAALAAIVVLPGIRPDAAAPLDEVATWQQRSQALEQQWQALPPASADPRARAELRLIDVELQSAYDRGAVATELVPLWKLRSEALHGLVNGNNPRSRAITRI